MNALELIQDVLESYHVKNSKEIAERIVEAIAPSVPIYDTTTIYRKIVDNKVLTVRKLGPFYSGDTPVWEDLMEGQNGD